MSLLFGPQGKLHHCLPAPLYAAKVPLVSGQSHRIVALLLFWKSARCVGSMLLPPGVCLHTDLESGLVLRLSRFLLTPLASPIQATPGGHGPDGV